MRMSGIQPFQASVSSQLQRSNHKSEYFSKSVKLVGFVAQMEPPAKEVWADERVARPDEEGQGGFEARQDQHLS